MKKENPFDKIREGFDPDKDFTFNLDQARNDLNSTDPVSVILRGHLYIENSLDGMIYLELTKPELFDFSGMNFSTKAKLCAAMGLIDQRTRNVCLKINKIRNDLAHYLNKEITEDKYKNLIEEYPLELKQTFLESIEKETGGLFSTYAPIKRTALFVREIAFILQGMRRVIEIDKERREIAQKTILKAAKAYQELCNLNKKAS